MFPNRRIEHPLRDVTQEHVNVDSWPYPSRGGDSFEPPPGSPEPHLLDYVKVVYRRRWIVATVFIVIVVGTAAYTFTATPIYEAKARLLLESDKKNVVSFKEVIEPEALGSDDFYQTQYQLLGSRGLAKRTLDAGRLWDHPQLKSDPARPGLISRLVGSGRRGNADQAAEAQLALAAASPGLEGETAAQSRVIDAFLRMLTVAPVRNSRLVDVKFQSRDAALAAALANAHARAFVQQDLDFKFSTSKEASGWLEQQLEEQRKQVEASEAAVQQYQERNDAVSPEEGQNIVVQKLTEVNAALTRAKTERIQKESLYNQVRAIENDPAAIDTLPAVLSNTFIQELKGQLADLHRQRAQQAERIGDLHPDMVKLNSAIQNAETKLQTEITKVVQSVKNEYLAAQAQEQSLGTMLESQKREALAMNRKGIEGGVLQRDVESNRQLYDGLLQRAKETGVAGELKTSNIRLVDAAQLPRSPIRPRHLFDMLLALMAGGVMALGSAFFFEYIDKGIKTPDEIVAHLGIPSLGLIPTIPTKSIIAGESPLISNGVPANFAEAFRTVRTNILFSFADEGPRSFVVTSTSPNEGKTLVASNLAIGLAQTGQRVLLIDADMRRARMHEIFKRSQEPGLSNLLVGDTRPTDAIGKSVVPGLWILPSGRVPPNPVELLGSVRFKAFLKSLPEQFDAVIIDSPPVMAVTDATVLAHLASAVVFVVAADRVNRDTAAKAVEQLQRARAHFVGAILNRVDLDRNGYYYSQYYRSDYHQYDTSSAQT